MLQRIDKKKKIFCYFFLFFLLTTFNNLSLIKSSKFNLVNIYIKGIDKDIEAKILNELKSLYSQNIFFFKNDLIKEKIEDFNFKENYNIKKIYPDTIEISIEKTKFLAEIKLENTNLFIGSNGKIIKHYIGGNKLPKIYGKLNIDDFLDFRNILVESKFDVSTILEYKIYPSGRWDIKIKDNLLIKFPNKNLLASLNILSKILKNENFEGNNVIDLRNSNYLIISNEP